MKLVIASDAFAPKIDGVSDTAGIVARSLAARGHEVVVVAPGPGETRMDGYRVARLGAVAFPLYPELRLAFPVWRLRRLFERLQPDAMLVFTPGPVGVSAAMAMQPGMRMVHIYTTDIPEYLSAYHLGLVNSGVERMLRWMSARAVATLCPTEHVRGALEVKGHARLAVWGRGVDTELFHPARRSADMRARLSGGEPEKPLVLFVGRLAREKRLIDLYKAGKQLPGVRFALVGDGPERDYLERKFAALPAVFTGYLRGEQLAAAFASADVFAFPSDTDTFGQVVLQAMASGVPPVVVAGSAPAEFVEHEAAGLHVSPREPAALAAAIRKLALDGPARSAMATVAAERARTYSWDALIDRLECIARGEPVPSRPSGADLRSTSGRFSSPAR